MIVQREEVIDAMGAFIAAYLANLPEAKKMDPKQLQLALHNALKVGYACTLRCLLYNKTDVVRNDSQHVVNIPLSSITQELRKGQARRLWDWGKTLYRAAAVSYAAFSMYENPWLVKALLKAMWAAAKLLLGAVII